MEKENLILVHSFPTNSILLSGLVEYLSDFFKVHFVDLPGFTKAVPPLAEITLEEFTGFFEDKVAEFNLDSFLVGGISFGFLVVNSARYNGRCKGILAMEPFLGPDSLQLNSFRRRIGSVLLSAVCGLRLSSTLWQSSLFESLMSRNSPPERVRTVLEQIDGRTFFETANMLLRIRQIPRFQNLPYVLIANKEDETVNYDCVYSNFTNNVESLLVVNTTIEHYPEDTSKAYFQEKMDEEAIREIVRFVSGTQ